MFGQLQVLVWFFMENYYYGVASSEFWCMGFTTSLGVMLLSLIFHLGGCYVSFFQVAM
jgi:hypothetical protein